MALPQNAFPVQQSPGVEGTVPSAPDARGVGTLLGGVPEIESTESVTLPSQTAITDGLADVLPIMLVIAGLFLYAMNVPTFPGASYGPAAVLGQLPQKGMQRLRKMQELLISSMAAFVIFLASLLLGLAEATGYIRVVNQFFWFAISLGAFGVFGSAILYLQRLWQK